MFYLWVCIVWQFLVSWQQHWCFQVQWCLQCSETDAATGRNRHFSFSVYHADSGSQTQPLQVWITVSNSQHMVVCGVKESRTQDGPVQGQCPVISMNKPPASPFTKPLWPGWKEAVARNKCHSLSWIHSKGHGWMWCYCLSWLHRCVEPGHVCKHPVVIESSIHLESASTMPGTEQQHPPSEWTLYLSQFASLKSHAEEWEPFFDWPTLVLYSPAYIEAPRHMTGQNFSTKLFISMIFGQPGTCNHFCPPEDASIFHRTH